MITTANFLKETKDKWMFNKMTDNYYQEMHGKKTVDP